jgi:kynurenine formamidase
VYEGGNRTPGEGTRPAAPRGAGDLGTLTMMTAESRNEVLSRISGDRVYDLSVQYFIGLSSWYSLSGLPPIVARGVIIDVAGLKRVPVLADDYRITTRELQDALAAERLALKKGDVVLIKGGKITLEAAQWLADTSGAMLIGGDALSLEAYKVGRPDMTVPVHKYLITDRKIAIIQVENLDVLVKDGVYEFAFVAPSIRPEGDIPAVIRPLAFPLRAR